MLVDTINEKIVERAETYACQVWQREKKKKIFY